MLNQAQSLKEEIIRLQSDIVAAQNQIRLLQKSIDENGAITKTLLNQLLDLISIMRGVLCPANLDDRYPKA